MYARNFDLSALNSGLNLFDVTLLFVAGIPILLIAILIWESRHHE